MAVTIGIDPHKLLHAAYAIDEHEHELARVEVGADARQCDRLLQWAGDRSPVGRWAIESGIGLGVLLAQQLVDAGEHVVDVPATLSSRVRLLGSGRSNKNDTNDARAVAIAALRAPITRLRARRGPHDGVAAAREVASRPGSVSQPGLFAVARAGAGTDRGWDPQRTRCFTG